MKRLNISITKTQEEKLENKSNETGMSKAEIVRRALDYYFDSDTGTSN